MSRSGERWGTEAEDLSPQLALDGMSVPQRKRRRGTLVQSAERRALVQQAPGSSPGRPTKPREWWVSLWRKNGQKDKRKVHGDLVEVEERVKQLLASRDDYWCAWFGWRTT